MRSFAPLLVSLIIACSGSERTSQPRGPAEGDPCPLLTAAADSDQAGGVPPSVAGEDIDTDLDALAAALPATAGDQPRGDTTTMPRGAAGHWSPNVLSRYTHDGSPVGVQILDLAHVCSCDAGMGRTLQSRRVRGGDATSVEIGGHPGILGTPANAPEELEVWVNDRCSFRVWAAPAPVLRSIANAVDWAALSAACPPL